MVVGLGEGHVGQSHCGQVDYRRRKSGGDSHDGRDDSSRHSCVVQRSFYFNVFVWHVNSDIVIVTVDGCRGNGLWRGIGFFVIFDGMNVSGPVGCVAG